MKKMIIHVYSDDVKDGDDSIDVFRGIKLIFQSWYCMRKCSTGRLEGWASRLVVLICQIDK